MRQQAMLRENEMSSISLIVYVIIIIIDSRVGFFISNEVFKSASSGTK